MQKNWDQEWDSALHQIEISNYEQLIVFSLTYATNNKTFITMILIMTDKTSCKIPFNAI